MGTIVFGLMRLLGQAQSRAQGGRKFTDCISGKIGSNGDVLGAPDGKAIGKITDQMHMNSDFGNEALIDGFWEIVEEVFGDFGS